MAKAGEGAGPCAIGEARGPEGEGCPPSSPYLLKLHVRLRNSVQ